MESFSAALGVVSGVAGIVALFLPAQGWRQRAVHIIYGMSIAVLAAMTFTYQAKLASISAVEYQASSLLKSFDLNNKANSRGFILASLSFLEKHRKELPDTYERAVKLAEQSGVLTNVQDGAVARLHQDWSMNEAAGAMQQLLTGIAAK